jgi:hypothetical protein
MAATADLLAAIDPGQQPPQSVRETGVLPWRMATTRDALPASRRLTPTHRLTPCYLQTHTRTADARDTPFRPFFLTLTDHDLPKLECDPQRSALAQIGHVV